PVHSLGASRLRTSALAMARAISRLHPEAILSTSSGGNMIASLGRLLSGWSCRLVLSERTTFSAARRERFPRNIPIAMAKRFLYRQADSIIAVSHGVADDLINSLRLPPGLVTVIYNPVVDDTLSDRAQETLDHPWFTEGPPVILAAGRLISQKDYPTLLRAFAELRRRRPARLIVLGEGPLRSTLEQLAADLGIAGDVQFPGFVPNPFPYMRRCTVFVLSSRFEGLPGVLIQAMACGAPVVSTDCPAGPAEIIEQDTSGLLVPVENPAALAGAIDRLLDDPALRRTMAAGAKRRAQMFGVADTVRKYERVLDGTRASRGGNDGAA
ncbi:MAG: glycosyltransferase, partial [bacterium]